MICDRQQGLVHGHLQAEEWKWLSNVPICHGAYVMGWTIQRGSQTGSDSLKGRKA